MEQIETMAGGDLPIIRIMPNTPVAVGQGMTLYCANPLVSPEELGDFLNDMEFSGALDRVPESLFDSAGTVTGCGPAYIYMFIEAMADGAVACGIPRAKALKYAAAAVAGAARLALESGQHPGALKDAVCSPGGSPIQGVRTLENRAFRGAVMEAVIVAAGASGDLGKK